jgi:catecholate siderophore receptor
MQSVSDIVRYVPGVTAGQGEGNRDQIVLRGNTTTADFYVDGVRDDVQYYRDVYNVDHVEALKGPNAMTFGRGGGGGVLNRVMKEAGVNPARELSVEGGGHDHARLSADLGHPLSSSLAGRFAGVYQTSRSFRKGVHLERFGINPMLTVMPGGKRTTLSLAYEHFEDHRTADRGIPSFEGRPYDTAPSTFFGDAARSYSDARVNAASATLVHQLSSGMTITNRTRFASYDKFYRNVFSGAVGADATAVSIQAYDNATDRANLFSQTDAIARVQTGSFGHVLLIGTEAGRQWSDHFRRTGYFNGTETSVIALTADPTVSTPITFRQSATDADNHVVNSVLSAYALDQIKISRRWQLVGGLRYDFFDIDVDNNRTGVSLGRRDRMLSPRLGLIYKPRTPLSLYSSLGVSYLPGSGDQFSALTDITRALKPERFTNYEVGAKWDLTQQLSLTTAAFRLDRTNTRANDPTNPGRIVQSGTQRTNGYEVALQGALTSAWDVVAGVAHQKALITRATTAAPAGAVVPLVPRNSASMWNRYQLTSRLALGAGVIHQARSYAAIDNSVTLPAFTRADVAGFYTIATTLRVQVNIENLFDVRYYPTANNNNNISPGAPRTLRLSLTTGI